MFQKPFILEEKLIWSASQYNKDIVDISRKENALKNKKTPKKTLDLKKHFSCS